MNKLDEAIKLLREIDAEQQQLDAIRTPNGAITSEPKGYIELCCECSTIPCSCWKDAVCNCCKNKCRILYTTKNC